jgi:hypothetical protein
VLGGIGGGVGLVLLTGGDHASNNKIPAALSVTVTNPFPETVEGTGTDAISGGGFYGQEAFRIRGALALLFPPRTGVTIRLFPEPVTCAAWFEGTPEAIWFDIDVPLTAASFHALPVGRKLRNFLLWWGRQNGNQTASDGVSGGSVTLTSVDTHAQGYWRGQVSVPSLRSAGGRRQELHGTFAAQYCITS